VVPFLMHVYRCHRWLGVQLPMPATETLNS